MPTMSRAFLLVAGGIVASASLLAQQPPEPPAAGQQAIPTLKAETREVVLDLVVTDRNHKPVLNLGREAFTLFESGTAQRIVSFRTPKDHEPDLAAAPIHSAADLLRAGGDPPLNLIVLDELNTKFEDSSYGRASAEKYLTQQPARLRQPTSVYSISDSGLKLLADYTQDRDQLVAVVKKHFPVYPFRLTKGGNAGPDASERLARGLGALLQLSQSVKGYGGRKSIVWIGRGFPSLNTDSVSADKAKEDVDAAKLVTSALLDSRTVLNIIDPTPLSVSTVDFGDPDVVSPNDLLNAEGPDGQSMFPGDINFADFAPATGGLAFFARNDVDREISTAIEDGASYYTISYTPSDKSDDPEKFRQVVVKLSDPNLQVWTRTGYYAPRRLQPGQSLPKTDVHQLAFDLTNAATTQTTYSGLIATVDEETRDPKGTLHVYISPVGLTVRRGPHESLLREVTYMEACFDSKNRPIEHHADEVTQPVTDPTASMSFSIVSPLPKGTARVRIVVRDAANARLGSVDLSPTQ